MINHETEKRKRERKEDRIIDIVNGVFTCIVCAIMLFVFIFGALLPGIRDTTNWLE